MYDKKSDLSSGEETVAKATFLNRMWCAKLEKLCCQRFGNHYLPDSADGRAMLIALLSFGMTNDSAINDASWCEAELSALKRKARRIKRRDVGKLISLTFDEWEAAELWFLRPIDKSEKELDAWRRDRRKAQDITRKKRKREQERSERESVRTANNRCDALLRMLEGKRHLAPLSPGITPPRFCGEWTSMPTLVELLIENTRAFRRPDGRCLSKPRNAIRTTIKRLKELGQVETELQPGPYGMVMMVRTAAIASGKADAFSGRPAALSAFPQKAHKTSGFEPKPSPSARKEDTMLNDPLPSPDVVKVKRRKAV